MYFHLKRTAFLANSYGFLVNGEMRISTSYLEATKILSKEVLFLEDLIQEVYSGEVSLVQEAFEKITTNVVLSNDKNWNEFFAIMNSQGQSNHFWNNGGAP